MRIKIKIPIQMPYNLLPTIQSHGWYQLLPNKFDGEKNTITRVEQLASGNVVLLSICGAPYQTAQLTVHVRYIKPLQPHEVKEIKRRVSHMFRLDEDLSDFYALCRLIGGKWKHMPVGSGYLMRSPLLFEDIVKVICTTNIQWGGTKRMVSEIVEAFGEPFPSNPKLKSFPSPISVAAVSFEQFQDRVRLGYRAAYIYQLAVKIATGDLDLDASFHTGLPTDTLRKRLMNIKGIGAYGAASLLMLMGRYNRIPVDTVFRDHMQSTCFGSDPYDERRALDYFSRWGSWKSLAYWVALSGVLKEE